MAQSPAYVRTEEAPKLRAPANLVGWRGWVMVNLFPNWSNAIITIVAGLFVYWVLSNLLGWAIFRAVWTGANRDTCAVEGAGACWPFVQAKFLQWVYGFYPIDQRWRVNMCFFVGACALIPLLIPSMPFKKWNVLFLLVVFPLLALILLTGGNFALAFTTFVFAVCALALIAAMLPLSVFGIEEGLRENKMAFWLAAVGLVLWLSNLLFRFPEVGTPFGDVPLSSLVSGILLIAGGACGIMRMSSIPSAAAHSTVVSWLVVVAVVLLSMFVLRVDFGLEFVETSQWGGLLVTLVVAITGIVFSLPLGILLAMGRRSNMPVVKYMSITYIEVWRGLPFITVLFMASNMLQSFLPHGWAPDKFVRALIITAIFASAYMAEVVRGGLQAIPRGQYEAAQALGLSYWKTMRLIILPQAIKIVVPGIVNNFIGLFKDTTLVIQIGLFDLLGIVIAGFADAKWASPQTAPTGYFVAAVIFWIFCFSMSRYSMFIERRLNTGHKR